MTSFGGVLTLDDVAGRPVHSVNSGPAMAPVAGKVYAGDSQNAIVCDMGGTSFDVSLIRDGYVKFTRETWLGGAFTGHMTGLSSVDVKSIGAGGGCIAWIDSGRAPAGRPRQRRRDAGAGLLRRAAARSRQSRTRPSCSATSIPTTSSEVGSGSTLEQAHEAIRCADRRSLGLAVEQAAYAIVAVANEHMVSAIRDITINEGLDPRDSVIVSGGGAGGLTIAGIAEELGCSRVLVPRTAAALSACGGQLSDVVTEFSVSRRADTNRFDRTVVNEGLEQLDASAGRVLRAPAGSPRTRAGKSSSLRRATRTRSGSSRSPLKTPRFEDDSDVAVMVEETSTTCTNGYSRSKSRGNISSACTGRDARPPVCRSPAFGADPERRSAARG